MRQPKNLSSAPENFSSASDCLIWAKNEKVSADKLIGELKKDGTPVLNALFVFNAYLKRNVSSRHPLYKSAIAVYNSIYQEVCILQTPFSAQQEQLLVSVLQEIALLLHQPLGLNKEKYESAEQNYKKAIETMSEMPQKIQQEIKNVSVKTTCFNVSQFFSKKVATLGTILGINDGDKKISGPVANGLTNIQKAIVKLNTDINKFDLNQDSKANSTPVSPTN
ncbi:MAG: hypothetical protein Tsb005_16050 [Gammaproteobacteria bacterium]